jgi:peptidoglycan/xylan/chitin deacetylase (PgdA/CDA1 family)
LVLSRFPILCYHSLDDSGSVISISPAQFRWQMEHLRANGWRALTLDEFLQGHTRGEWSPRTFLLTFDDGFENFLTHALPVLMACRFPATVFVVTDWIGKTNDWQGQWRSAVRGQLLDWNELRAIADSGIEIGGHSLSHPYLPRLVVKDAKREIIESKHVIEDRIGCAVQAFAYPYGKTSRAVEKIVAANFRAGFGTRLGFATTRSRAAVLERIDMFYLRQPLFFRALAEGWLPVYLRVRQLVRDVRGISEN